MGDVDKFFCQRCGAEMNKKARCCLKCGYLNPIHPDNKSMEKYSKASLESYSVGSGRNIIFNNSNKFPNLTTIGNNTGSKRLCFWINLITYLFLLLIIVLYVYFSAGSLMAVIGSNIYIYLLIATILIFVFYSFELVYMKMNKKWWSSLIPIYNMMVLSDAVLKSYLLGLIVFIPIVGQIFLLYILFKLGLKFKKSGFLTALIPFVMFPIIGFGSSSFEGHNYVDEEENAREKEYKRSRIFLLTITFISLLCVGMFIYNNFTFLKKQQSSISRNYYVGIAKKMVKKTKWSIDHNRFSCEKYVKSNELVFYFADVGDEFNLPFALYNNVISGYVVATKDNNDNYTYTVSLTDGERGIPEVSGENISVDEVINFTELDKKHEYGLSCVIK